MLVKDKIQGDYMVAKLPKDKPKESYYGWRWTAMENFIILNQDDPVQANNDTPTRLTHIYHHTAPAVFFLAKSNGVFPFTFLQGF